MIKIAGIWEQGWTTPIMEISLWRFMLNEFLIDAFYMTPVSGICTDYPIEERASLQDVIDENPKLVVVHVDEKGKEDLKDFVHPKNALYLFGRAGTNTLGLKTLKYKTVKIPTTTNQGGFWPHQAASIILYDRYLKSK